MWLGVAQAVKYFVDLYVAQPPETPFQDVNVSQDISSLIRLSFENITDTTKAARVSGTALFIVDR
ncbi:uncharacterized protein EAF01_000420 [Botrytis porri]|uniref:uncharacterized protein n=1 Tax=Botrytis porri TaxID=87229 RepID=UPI0018FF3CBB|nr:uncharacterized protein EAF01_000420 [Botrytis porri]KAF7914014.1 hypothetical protein EAF01_000420 [Botrytis porri]